MLVNLVNKKRYRYASASYTRDPTIVYPIFMYPLLMAAMPML